MKPEHAVSILAVAVTVPVVALFLIAIVVELRRTSHQLVTILGAVVETVEKTDPLDSIVAEIVNDLTAGQQVLASCVDRLEERLGGPPSSADGATSSASASTADAGPSTHATPFTNY